jgi:PAS domain S-box-containing protein
VRRLDGPILGIVLVFRDISQQRKGQEAMERLVAIVESSEDAVFSNTLDGRIRTWNLGAQRMFGHTPEEILGKSLALLLPADRSQEEEQNLQRLKEGGRVAAFETRRLTRDGRAIDVSVTVSALRSEAGQIIGLSQIVRDITERKRAQSELQRLNAELERRVAERTRSLQEATEQLNAFCYSVAHDLQAPLRAQLAFAQVLLEDYGSAVGASGQDYIERIAQSAERQGRLVRDLLAHVSLSRTDLPVEAVDLANAVEQARLDLQTEIQSRNATLNLGPLAGKVLANPSSLHLIIMNLISNALKFVARGTPAWVRVWSEQRNGVVRVWVEDKGIGIQPKHLGKIFGVFQRLHTIDEYPGTGIGLAIVKKAVERMNGHVGVESQPGAGSRFWVELREASDREPIASPSRDRDRVMLPTRALEHNSPQI